MKKHKCSTYRHHHSDSLLEQSRRKTGLNRCFGLLSLMLVSVISPSAMALEFHCEAYGQQRQIRVEIPGKNHLCVVSITSQPSGERKVAWYARNDTSYCSTRASELRDRYEQQWNYTCTTKSGVNGVEELSKSQRMIFDSRLNLNIDKAKNATPSYNIVDVRTIASTPLDKQAAKVAIQYFTDKGEFIEIIDDKVQSWDVVATDEQLSDRVISVAPLSSVLMHSISDAGTIEVRTQFRDHDGAVCHGKQLFELVANRIEKSSRHRFTCKTDANQLNAKNETAPLGARIESK